MEKRIKKYYELKIKNDPKFAEFVKQTAKMTYREIAIKYKIDINKFDKIY